MKRLVVFALAILMLPAICLAEPPCMMQITTTSWHGLSGLYVIPTARILGAHKLAIGFNESKHTEFIRNGKFTDRHIRGVLTYGFSDRFEIYGSFWNNIYTVPPGIEPQLSNRTFQSFGLKYLVMTEDPHYWFPAVAIGVRDVANRTADVEPLKDVGNGTKGFLLVSKRMLRDERIGRFMDVHLGLTFDQNTQAGLFGIELTLAPNASLIVEGIWDSPYLNFHHFGADNQQGRFVFNPGLRIYPELVPGMALDLGFVGDSEFEFSFGASYVASL